MTRETSVHVTFFPIRKLFPFCDPGDQEIFSVLPIFDAFVKLPSPKEFLKLATERTEELDVELTEATSEEEIEQVQDKQREELEQKKMTWD